MKLPFKSDTKEIESKLKKADKKEARQWYKRFIKDRREFVELRENSLKDCDFTTYTSVLYNHKIREMGAKRVCIE